MADSAADMMVVMDRSFPGVALWKAYTQAGAHLPIRARTFIAAKPMDILPDETYTTRMCLAGQRRSHPGGVTVRVTDYKVDGGETIRLLTDLLEPEAGPAAELAALYHERWEVGSAYRQLKDLSTREGRSAAVGVARTDTAGDGRESAVGAAALGRPGAVSDLHGHRAILVDGREGHPVEGEAGPLRVVQVLGSDVVAAGVVGVAGRGDEDALAGLCHGMLLSR